MLDDIFIVDAHQDIAYHLTHFKRDFVEPKVQCQITLPWLREAGVRLVFNTIFIHPRHKPSKSFENAMLQLDTYDKIYSSYPHDIRQIKETSDLITLHHNNSIGFLTLMEGADPLKSPEDLEMFYQRGVRIIGPAWNNMNLYASGPDTENGITSLGFELLEKMNKLGITLDLSHLNIKCFWEAIEKTRLIPIATHSNSRALRDHPRNLYDDQLKAIAERGGVVGLVLYGPFLKTSSKKATLTDLFAHADHIINLIGEDHVGIGTDLDGAEVSAFPPEIKTIADLPKIVELFLREGYSEERVKKIMGENFLRVLKKNLTHSEQN